MQNLIGQRISISDYLSKGMQEHHSALLSHLKQEKINNPGIKCTLLRDKLIVRNKVLDRNLKETHSFLGQAQPTFKLSPKLLLARK